MQHLTTMERTAIGFFMAMVLLAGVLIGKNWTSPEKPGPDAASHFTPEGLESILNDLQTDNLRQREEIDYLWHQTPEYKQEHIYSTKNPYTIKDHLELQKSREYVERFGPGTKEE